MNYPLQENLEVATDSNGAGVRCARCHHVLGPVNQDWKSAARRHRLAPEQAGSLMAELRGQFLLEQLCCPSCGALFHTDLVEDRQETNTTER